MASERKKIPLIILGLDAGDPGLICHWARDGYLPTIDSIMKRGLWGTTGGPELVSEHGVWVSLFSGLSRGRHGFYYFRQLEPGTYNLRDVTGLDIEAPPFWRQLLGSEKKVAIVDVPDIYPVPGLAGVQLNNWASHQGWVSRHPAFALSAEPAGLLAEIRRSFGAPSIVLEESRSNLRNDRHIYRRLKEQIENKGALCRHLLARDAFDLIVLVFSESHTAGHQFWKYHRDGAAGGNDLRHAIRDIYQEIDRQMGLVLAGLPEEANVFVVSSVGMEDDYPTSGLMDAFCRELGYQAAPAEPPLWLSALLRGRRLLPDSWRIALSGYLSRSTHEALLAKQFRNNTDWRRTAAFPIPSFYTGFLRVNLRGREPEGIVEPGAEYNNLLARLEADFKKLVDPRTGSAAVRRLSRATDLFGSGPHLWLPDLFVQWSSDRFMQRVIHPRVELVQRRPGFFRVSDHSDHGFVAVAGPSIEGPGALGDVSVLDLAPTFMSLLGERVPAGLTGRVMGGIRTG